MHHYKIQRIIAYEPQGETNKQIYREYLKQFPSIFEDLREFFRGYPERIVHYHNLNVFYDFLEDFKDGRMDSSDHYEKSQLLP